jgi:hypothetical protein
MQSTASLQCFFRPGCDCGVHPVTGLAFADPFELYTLDGEGFADEGVQIDSRRDDIRRAMLGDFLCTPRLRQTSSNISLAKNVSCPL